MNNESMILRLNEIFQTFMEFNEKEFKANYNNLNINEVHAIDYIGRTEKANVTKITNHLKISKGGVTKITKKLISKEYIIVYQNVENKKEKYFSLTEKGKEIFIKHKKLHMIAMERDQKIFQNFTENEKEIISNFLNILKNDLKEKMK
ncbi:MarR family transcriptional regulator [Fusobacterium sp. MFO224]|uniref:MarR family transcriptional regulator n=1 Tax=Fusobacterium sp. MFO224 TaxID=3378070 RepID=UPI003853C80D